jgi:hypothetical protein
MSKSIKLLDKLQSKPSPKNFAWNELRTVLLSLGYKEAQGSGSRVKFVNKSLCAGKLILLHKRHPDPTLLKYQVKAVLTALQEARLL